MGFFKFFKTDKYQVEQLRQQLAEINEVIFEYEWRRVRPEASFLPSSPADTRRRLQQIEDQVEFLKLQKQVWERQQELQKLVKKRQQEFQTLVKEREKYLQQRLQQVRGQGGSSSSN